MKKQQRLVASITIAMRISVVQIMMAAVFAGSLYAKEADGQSLLQKTFTLKADNMPMAKVIRHIQKQTGVKFSYSANAIGAERTLTFRADNTSIGEFIGGVLRSKDVGYRVIDDKIVLYRIGPTEAVELRAEKPGLPERIVRGRVTDEKGQAIEGATVNLKGSNNSTQTGRDGSFAIETPDDNAILQISSIGYENLEIAVADIGNGSIALKEKADALENVVVIGYGKQRRRDLTGSVSSVNAKDLKSLPVPSIGDALQGRAAGVQVVTPGAPGSNVTFRIRGTGTINNSDPLLVIDGVPTDIPLNTFNPDDIQSIEVLKDASAAAIYGSRGANGVVLITTKKGVAGRNNLEFKSFVGQQEATNMVELLDAAQFASLHNEMMAANGQSQNPAYSNPQALGKGTDWLNALFNKAAMQHYSLAFSGGAPKYTYYISGGMLDQKGIVMNTNYRRYTVQFNSDGKLFDWLRIGNNLTLNTDLKKSGDYNIRNTMAALPTQPIYKADGSWSGPVGQASWVGDIRNPIGTATLTERSTRGYNALGNLYVEMDVLKSLKFRTMGGVQASFWNERTWSPRYDWQPIPQPQSYLFQGSNKSITLLWDNFLTYTQRFGDLHDITALLGSSAQNNRFDFMNGSIQNFASNSTQQLANGTGQQTIDGNASEWSLLSFFGRINYSFDNRFLITGTIRRDGSSRFGAANRWGWFPSASAAWRITEENFLQNIKWLNELKLRAGYGVTGNQNIGNYSFASVLQTVQYNFNGQPVTAVVPLAIPNPNVRWEGVEQMNVGVDATLFNNRVNITLDGYIKNTNDMLVPMSVPVSTGYSDITVPSINAGKVQNKGIELTVNTRNTTGKLEWRTNFNVSFNRNEVQSLNDSIPLYTGSIGLNQNLTIQRAGFPVGSFYGFVTNGIFQSQAEVEKYAVQQGGSDPFNSTSAGDIRFRDLNSDGRIDDADRTYIGNPAPRFIFAMENTFAYKGFDLSIFLQGVEGNEIFNANRIYQEGMAVAQNQTVEVLNRWTPAKTSATMPRAVFNDPNKNTRVSNRFVEDGSYLRIKNITVGYNLPASLIRRAKMQTARIYLSAQNVATFTNYKGFDPEVGVNGIDLNVYPVTRIISAGINVIF